MNKKIGFGLYQACVSRGSIGCVSVFEMQWCMWGVDQGLGVLLCLCEV